MSDDNGDGGATLRDLRRRDAGQPGPVGPSSANELAAKYFGGGQGGTAAVQRTPTRPEVLDDAQSVEERVPPSMFAAPAEDHAPAEAPAVPPVSGPPTQPADGLRAPIGQPEQPAPAPAPPVKGEPGVPQQADGGRPVGYDAAYAIHQMVPAMRARATRGWRSRLGMQPSAKEREDRKNREAMCVNFGRPIWVVIANPKGSAGKTPLTLEIAGAFGIARGGGSLAFEAHESRGTMALRTAGNAVDPSVREFVDDLDGLPPSDVRYSDVAAYARHQAVGQFDAMTSPLRKADQLKGDEFLRAQGLLGRFYDVIAVDTANNEEHSSFRAAMEIANVLVVPVKWRPDVVIPAIQMLEDELRVNPALVANAIVVASHGPGDEADGCRAQFAPYFAQLARSVLDMPTDPHIHSAGVLVHDQLREQTRRAVDRVGAAIADAALDNLRHGVGRDPRQQPPVRRSRAPHPHQPPRFQQ